MSFRMQINPRSRKAARFINSVHRQLQSAYVRASAKGINQQHIADTLGVDRSTVNKRLLGTSNLTLRTISDLAWAMGENVRLVVEPSESLGQNYSTKPAAAGAAASSNAVVSKAIASTPSTYTSASFKNHVHIVADE